MLVPFMANHQDTDDTANTASAPKSCAMPVGCFIPLTVWMYTVCEVHMVIRRHLQVGQNCLTDVKCGSVISKVYNGYYCKLLSLYAPL